MIYPMMIKTIAVKGRIMNSTETAKMIIRVDRKNTCSLNSKGQQSLEPFIICLTLKPFQYKMQLYPFVQGKRK